MSTILKDSFWQFLKSNQLEYQDEKGKRKAKRTKNMSSTNGLRFLKDPSSKIQPRIICNYAPKERYQDEILQTGNYEDCNAPNSLPGQQILQATERE
uniref:Uncharacterized protein n=1 Tax=Rhizophora mucronata TaxID=61149 RepID=A0A2P2KKE3_RHIMU